MSKISKKTWVSAAVILAALMLILSLPPVWSRVSYHAREWYGKIKYALFPPSAEVFIPGGAEDPGFVATSVAATLSAYAASPTVESPATPVTPMPTYAPTATPLPLPPYVYLEGVIPEAQLWNNCGPATLSMNLSYYDWGKDQKDAAAVLKPNDRDKNVMPYEMVDFVNENTDLRAISRMGGDLQTLKSLVSAGFPVLVEKGFEPENLNEGWMGHFNLVVGYDDTRQVFFTHDSYLIIYQKDDDGIPGVEVPYEEMLRHWRSFNYVFVVVYPPDKVNDMLNALGPLQDQTTAYRVAYERAKQEINTLPDPREKFFAWFNAGTSLVYLQDYAGAADAYDMAFAQYPSIEEAKRPWRIFWYETGPYFAYYYSGRYQDVIDLADQTLQAMNEPVLEESYYWRARAKVALGDQKAAIKDLRQSLENHPGFIPSLNLLQELGEIP
jgi:hypothetical protein